VSIDRLLLMGAVAAAVLIYIWVLIDIVRRRRPDAWEWFMAVTIIPVVGAVVYLLFGRRKPPRP